MRIELTEPKYTMVAINRTLTEQETKQLARKIEKYALKQYSILFDQINVK